MITRTHKSNLPTGMQQQAWVVVLYLSTLIALHHFGVGLVLRLEATDVLKSFGIQLFSVVLPGTAMYAVLYRREQNALGAMFISYILGYSMNIIFYFLVVPFGLKHLAPALVAICAIVSVFVVHKYGKHIILRGLTGQDAVFFLLFLVQLVLNVLAYSAATISPAHVDNIFIPVDHLYWIENASALVRQFPPLSPRMSFDTYYYHYFSSIQIAFQNIVTGVDCFTLGTSLYSIGKSLIFFGAIYVFTCSLTKNVWLRLLGVITSVFSCGFEGASVVTYVSHVWTHPFGFDIGFAYGMFFLHCFYLQEKKPKIDLRVLALTLLSLFVCTGSKAPVAVVAIVAAGIVCFCWLFKRQFVLGLIYGTSMLTVVSVVTVFCIGYGLDESISTGGFSIWQTIRDIVPIFSQAHDLFAEVWPETFRVLIILFFNHIATNGVLFGLFFAACLSFLADKKMRTAKRAGLMIATAWGIGLGAFNVQDGVSQMYFTMSAFVPCLALDLSWLDLWSRDWKQPGKRFACILLSVLLFFQVLCFIYQGFTYWGSGMKRAVHCGLNNIENIRLSQSEYPFDTNRLQTEDYSALSWIRDNTPEDSIVLSDRCVMSGLSGFMYYGTFSERQAYLEGDSYYRKLYIDERSRRRELIKQLYQNHEDALPSVIADGVDYIIQTKWLTPDFTPNEELISLVFSTKTINVYEVIH